MTFTLTYATPAGFDDLSMESDGEVLTGLGFVGSREGKGNGGPASDIPVFRETCRWLDIYFSGHQPDFTPPYRLVGATPFREAVSREMLKIPFGATATYGDIASAITKKRGLARMSAQAVGQAVGWNPICIIIPCHRVIGVGGALTGYGGGLHNKTALLELERNQFVCQRCGACCRIPNGIVRVSDAEIARIAAFLGMTEAEFIERETEVAPDRKGLILKSCPDGACAWLMDDNLCRINPVKPDKCRTFPGEWRNSDSETVCPALGEHPYDKTTKKG